VRPDHRGRRPGRNPPQRRPPVREGRPSLGCRGYPAQPGGRRNATAPDHGKSGTGSLRRVAFGSVRESKPPVLSAPGVSFWRDPAMTVTSKTKLLTLLNYLHGELENERLIDPDGEAAQYLASRISEIYAEIEEIETVESDTASL